MEEATFFKPIANRFAKMAFGNAVRIKFYNQLSMMLENRVMLVDALREMLNVASDNGKVRTTMTILLKSCFDALSEGKSFSEAMTPWVNANEVAVIAAGEQAGDLVSSFRDAIAMIESGAQVRSAVVGASIYPIVLISMLCVLLNIIGNSLVPKLSSVSDPTNWEGAGYVLYVLGEFVIHYGKFALIGVAVMVIMIALSFPLLGGKVRNILDKIPPWSLYRVIHGSIFMLNVSLLLRSGMMLQSALELLAKRAGSRWLRVRIRAVLDRIAGGSRFGDALRDSGYDFPDSAAINYLRLLSGLQGFDESMAKFARYWLEGTIAKVRSISRVFLIVAIFSMGAMLVLVVTAVSDIEGSIEQASVSQV